MKASILLLFLFSCVSFSGATNNKEPEDKEVALAIVKTCTECRLKNFPQLKAFVEEDLPLFHDVYLIGLGGTEPVFILLNKDEEEIKRIPMDKLNRQQCNDLILSYGFYKKSHIDEEVPEEYKSGPVLRHEEL